jgi:hypothetical protein
MVDKMEQVGSVPVPDPTKLTTDAVALARAQIEKLFDVQITGVHKDVAQLELIVKEIPVLALAKQDRLKELLEEKFVGVKTEFTMRDIALAAAFKAAEAAVKQQNESNTLAIDKAGTAFTKQIDSLDEKIDDLKERISMLARKDWSVVGAYIVGSVGVAALVAAALLKH